jgi:tripartite-type tricarboxylate transporter receptor subunit TctC
MARRRSLLATAPALAALRGTPTAHAQAWPAGPIRGVVPFAPGSATDTVARLFGEAMRPSLGQPLVIENRAGAGGMLGAEVVARAAPDGMTLLFGTNSTHAAATALFRRVPFDAARDFAPVSTLASVPLVLCVRGDSRYATLADLLTDARARPEAITYAQASASQHVAVEMMASMAGVRMLMVPYRASPLAAQDLIGGRVDLFAADPSVMLPHIQAGTVRGLAVTSSARAVQLPRVPTVAEAGNLAGYELFAWFMLLSPAGTPAAIISRLNEAVRAAAALPDLQNRLTSGLGMSVFPSSPEQAATFIATETQKWTSAIRAAGIQPE